MLTCKSQTLGWDIYLGEDHPLDSSAEAVVVHLITNTGLTVQSAGIIYTDSWYKYIKLARTLFEKYDWLFFGTSAPTEMKNREEYDIPFHKLSNFVLNSIVYGWSRRATTPIIGENGKKGIVKVTTWKYRKQVMFVRTHMVGSMDGETSLRHVKGQNNGAEIDCPPVAKDYAVNMNGVDKSDRYGINNYVKIRTNRCYLII